MKTNRLLAILAAVTMLGTAAACSDDSGQGPAGNESPADAGADDGAEGAQCTPGVSDAALITPGVLTYSTNATLPPVQYVEGDEIKGMRIELAAMIAEELCLEVEPINVPFDVQIPGVQSGRWDMINTGMFYTEERAETLTLVPYEAQAVAISVTQDHAEEITTVEDLAGKTIGVEAPGYEFDSTNLLNEDLKAAGLEPMTINTSLTNADAFQALSAGQLDGVVTVEAVTTYYQADGRFVSAIDGLRPGPLAFGFNKENEELANAVAEALNRLDEEGKIQALFDEYQVTPFPGPFEIKTGPVELQDN